MPTWAWILVVSAAIVAAVVGVWVYIIVRDARRMSQL